MKNLIFAILALSLLAGAFFALSGSRLEGAAGDDDSQRRGGMMNGGVRDDVATARNTMMENIRENRNETKNAIREIRDDDSLNRSEKMMGIRAQARMLRNETKQSWDDYLEERKSIINESGMDCNDEGSMMARMQCRMKATFAANGNSKNFMPEECRNLTNDSKKSCIAENDILGQCRMMGDDGNKTKCARAQLGTDKGAKELVEECKLKLRTAANSTNPANSTNSTASTGGSVPRGIGQCVSGVRSRMHEEIKFKMDTLSDKALRLKSLGVSDAAIASFMAKVEELKLKFDAAADNDARKAVLREAEGAWKEFYKTAADEIRKAREGRKNAGGNSTVN